MQGLRESDPQPGGGGAAARRGQLIEWFVTLSKGSPVLSRCHRHIDASLTSVTLNIADGNARYSQLDHSRFLDLAASSAVKATAYLDLAVQQKALNDQQQAPAKQLLMRVVAMLSRM